MLPTIMMRPMFVFLWTLPLAFWVLMFFVFLGFIHFILRVSFFSFTSRTSSL